MELKFKKLHPDAIIPTKAHDTDAGFDLYVPKNGRFFVPWTKNPTRIPLSIAVDIPEGYFGLICGRSSLAAKGIDILGGVVDAGYHGEITVVISLPVSHSFDGGDKIAQLVILPLPSFTAVEVDEFNTVTERGTKGFGSSGR